MALTIKVNGLTLCHKGSGGVSIATAPDVCNTPAPGGPVPVPYPNVAYSKHLRKGTKTVKVDGGNPVAIKGSEFAVSTGDEPGTAGGVKSGTFKKEATWLSFSMDVKMEGKPVCRLTDKMLMNHGNTVNMGGLLQKPLKDPKLNILCEIFCQTRKEGHDFKKNPANKGKRFPYSQRAKALAKSEGYAGRLKKLGKFIPERSVLVSVPKGALGKTTRKVYTQAALRNRLLKELGEKAGKKLAKKSAKSAALKFIPSVNLLSLAWDAYDLVSTGIDVYNAVGDFMKKYDTFRIKPDMAEMGPDGEIKKIYDYKFDYPDGGTDSMSLEQRKLYSKKAGQKVEIIDND